MSFGVEKLIINPSLYCAYQKIQKSIRKLSIFFFNLFMLIEGPIRNGPIKRTPGRLPRIPFTPHQLNELESAYKRANYLSSEDANHLALRLDLTCVRVKIWFQNRRARERREKRELNTSTATSMSLTNGQLS